MALLLSDVRTALENVKRDISDVSAAVFLQWCNYGARSLYRKLSNQVPERFVDTHTYTAITSGAQNLPADFNNIQVLGTGLFEVNTSGTVTSVQLPKTSYGSTSKGYYITGSTVVFTGITTATTYILRYIPELVKYTDASTNYFTLDGTSNGVELIPQEYEEALVADLCKFYEQWDDNAGQESLDDFRFVRCMNEMLGDFDKDVHVFGTDQIIGAF